MFITTNNVHNSTPPAFNLSIFTEQDGTAINNEDFSIRKHGNIYSIL